MSADVWRLAADFAVLFLELVALLVAVSAAVALLARRVGLTRLRRWLGGSAGSGALKGMLLGFVVPFCTYSAIPAVVAMIEARLRTATLAGFLLAAPLLDPLVLAVLALLFGWQATAAYAIVTAGAVLALALLADATAAERLLRPRAAVPAGPGSRGASGSAAAGGEPGGAPGGASAGCEPDPFSDDRPWRGLAAEGRQAAGYAAAVLRRLAVPMLLAVVVAAAVVGVVPRDLLAGLAGPGNPLAVPAAAALGVPFYVSTEAFLPVASALHASGMSLGATFALVVSAAGVNLPELALLSRLMRPALLAGYTAAVVTAAVAAGYLIPLLV